MASELNKDERYIAALMSLARELWVVKDRQRVLETLLAKQSLLAPSEIESHQPDERTQTRIDAECRDFVNRIVSEIVPLK